MLGNEDIGIDMGTATMLICVRGKGIVLREPAVVALDRQTRNILAVGEEAQRMMGRTPANIAVIRPLHDGTVTDYDITERMLRFFLRKVMGKRSVFRPRVVACVPTGVTEVEKRSMVDTILDAGARKAQLVEEALAAAIGAGVDVTKAYGNMVLDIGGGTSTLAVLAMGRSVVTQTIKIAGDRFDEAITRYLRRKHNLMIGERTAEELKIQIGAACPRADALYLDVTGRSLITGLPKTVRVSSEEMVEALDEPIAALAENIQALLERTPPELAADIFERGIVMTGGGSMLYGLDLVLSEQVRVPCRLVEDPVACVALGTSRILEDRDAWTQLLFDIEDDGTARKRR
jgi:rod shape-determining protein MreB